MENVIEVLHKGYNQVTIVKTSIVNNCLDCPYREYEKTMDGCWYSCNHKEAPSAYEDIIYFINDDFEKTPDWCPMGLR